MINLESYPVNAIKDKLSDSERERINVKNLLAEIEKLPEKEKLTLQMRYKEKKTLRECGKRLCLSPSMIHSMQEKARRRLTRTSMTLNYIKETKENVEELTERCKTVAQSLGILTDNNSMEKAIMALAIPVHDLNISIRTLDSLKKSEITRALDLAEMTEREFLHLWFIGFKALAEVNSALEEVGLPPLRKQ